MICTCSQTEPQKEVGEAQEENSRKSQGKKAKKQLFESRPSEDHEGGLSTSSHKTVSDHEPSTETRTLDKVEVTGIHLDRFLRLCAHFPLNCVQTLELIQ